MPEFDIDPVLDLGFSPDDHIPKTPWFSALEAQMDLYKCLGDPLMEVNAANFFYHLAETNSLTTSAMAQVYLDKRGYAKNVLEELRGTIGKAPTYYVSPMMCSVIEQNAEEIPNFELRSEDIPAESGFVYFGRPMNWAARDGSPVRIRALAWEVLRPMNFEDNKQRVSITWFVHRDEIPDSIAADKNPKWKTYTARWIIDTMTLWPVGWDWSQVGEDARAMLTFWLVTNQKIGVPRGLAPDRRLRRQAERTLPNYGDIRVCYLRKRVPREQDAWEYPDTDGGPKYSHRFPVKGHWRNQWYPSEDRHKPIWIAPFIKGPDDAPLIIKDTINVVNR